MSFTVFNSLEQLPPDVLFDVKKRLSKDERPFKVDLGIGAYRDEEGKPWILPSVRQAEKALQEGASYNHEYLNISGLPSFTAGAARILFGEDSEAIAEGRVISLQSLSGTGALHIASRLLLKAVPDALVYISDPTWANHKSIFETQGLKTVTYPYWNARTKSLDIEGFLKTIEEAPRGSVFIVHTCAHNPTGTDPTEKQWGQLVDKFAAGGHIVLFDTAYQGFATGDLAGDAFSLRLGVKKLASVSPILVCQSFAKNAGMYGERVGAFHVVLPRLGAREETAKASSSLLSQLNLIARSEYSNPPAYGAKVVDKLLNTPALFKKWHEDMETMSSRIMKMRHSLRDRLVQLGTPGNWDHIVEQCGMFSYTGLSSEMVERLEKEHAVYMVSSGRASIAGLNEGNVNHVAASIDSVVRYFSQSRL